MPKRRLPDLDSPDLYLNREIEWLRFNERVLSEGELPDVPIMERLKFLTIFDSNLDEFFMVRLSGLLRLIERAERGEGCSYPDVADPEETFDDVSSTVRSLLRRHRACLVDDVIPGLRTCGIEIVRPTLDGQCDISELDEFFDSQVFPVLTPLALDPAHPFPFLGNLSLYLAILFEAEDSSEDPRVGFVEMPQSLSRFVRLSDGAGARRFLLLEDLVKRHVGKLFPWSKVTGVYAFRVTRNLDYQLLETEVKDLMKSVEFELKDRAQKIALRLETEPSMPEWVRSRLRIELDLDASDVYSISDILALRDAWALVKLDVEGAFRDPAFAPRNHPSLDKGEDLFAILKERDLILHHPYDSFGTVLEFLRSAAEDPDVLAIKQTLYRTGGDSPVTEILTRAAENGKQVTAVVELKARFDERTNIDWARKLERSGVHVVFGFVGLKTHAKCALIVRRENGAMKRYAHLSTGNYNVATAKLYTDIALLTSREALTADVMRLFNVLTGFNITRSSHIVPIFEKIKLAPFDLRSSIVSLIHAECAHHRASGNGRIILKMNALLDPKVIRALYEASCQGVRIELIIRGMCALRPGLSQVSKNIRVISVIDRFLEHSRVFWFQNGTDPLVYLGSADMMVRNLDKRIEVLWPVEAMELKEHVLKVLEMYLQDNIKSHKKNSDGTYQRTTPDGSLPFRVQSQLGGLSQG